MLTSTKVSLVSAAGWLVLNIIASGFAPSGLHDPEFEAKVATASFFQGLGNLCMLIAIIAILMTAYKRVMDKQVEHHHHKIEARDNAIVATDQANVAVGGSRIDNSRTSIVKHSIHGLTESQTSAVRELLATANSALIPASDREAIDAISSALRKEIDCAAPQPERVLSYAKSLAQILESVKPIAESIKLAIELLRP